MSQDRLPSYESRWWATSVDIAGIPTSVHHFVSEEIRDGWVMMDPDLRVAVAWNHPAVKAWLRAGKPSTPNLFKRFTKFLHLA